MSVWVTAIIPHKWQTPTLEVANGIASVVAPNEAVSEWRKTYPYKSPEEQWEQEQIVNFKLPKNYMITFGKSVAELARVVRWSWFLADMRERRDFLSACGSIGGYLGATAVIIAPEGSPFRDLLYEGRDFVEITSEATKLWGEPDLDLIRAYSEHELKYRCPRLYLGCTEEVQMAARLLH